MFTFCFHWPSLVLAVLDIRVLIPQSSDGLICFTDLCDLVTSLFSFILLFLALISYLLGWIVNLLLLVRCFV
jgi:hypothetical protein